MAVSAKVKRATEGGIRWDKNRTDKIRQDSTDNEKARFKSKNSKQDISLLS